MVLEEDRTGTWHAYGKKASGKFKSSQDANVLDDRSSLAFFKPISLAGSTRFAGYMAISFPEVVASIEPADLGVLHLEVAALKVATHEAITKRDWSTVRKHFIFIDNMLEIAETGEHDAIGISYLVNLFYNETSINFAKARTLMPKRLATALEIMERHYEELKF